MDDDDGDVDNIDEDIDRDSSSNRALAGSSRSKKSKISFDPKLNEQQQKQQVDVKSFDSYSMTISEKSINPSVSALAGSIRDNQSINSNDDKSSSNQQQLKNITNEIPSPKIIKINGSPKK